MNEEDNVCMEKYICIIFCHLNVNELTYLLEGLKNI